MPALTPRHSGPRRVEPKVGAKQPVAEPSGRGPTGLAKEDCPRCGGRYLNPADRRCIACGADFTEQGLVEFRARPTLHALRS